MISFTYAVAGCLLAVTGYLFWQGAFTSVTQTLAWSCVFFFASAGASAAYLTVSEIFPLEIRAMAIAFFFVVAQGAGIVAPWLYGKLIETSAHEYFLRLLTGSRDDARGRARGTVLRGQGRGAVARIHCHATLGGEVLMSRNS